MMWTKINWYFFSCLHCNNSGHWRLNLFLIFSMLKVVDQPGDTCSDCNWNVEKMKIIIFCWYSDAVESCCDNFLLCARLRWLCCYNSHLANPVSSINNVLFNDFINNMDLFKIKKIITADYINEDFCKQCCSWIDKNEQMK